jgi:AraC family transcriptional regulator of adaptative response / DNA-3-methyladenine glycosylase II
LTLERVLSPAGPYSLALTARHAGDATRRFRDGSLTTTIRAGDRVELGSATQLMDGRMVLRAESEAGIEKLRFLLALDADHSEFLRRFATDQLIGRATLRFQGLRQMRVGTVAQTLLRALCGQLIEARRAREIEFAIIRAAEPRIGGSKLHAPPTCESLGNFAPARLRQFGLHARRAAALIRICRSIELERLHDLPTSKVAELIERERGLGPWSSGLVCLEGLGRHDRGLVGDLALVKLMSRLRGRWVETHETAELLAPYGEWAGLASRYLIMGFGHGLIPLPGDRPRRTRAAFA